MKKKYKTELAAIVTRLFLHSNHVNTRAVAIKGLIATAIRVFIASRNNL